MLVFYVPEEEIKIFMNKLLREETFDKLEVRNFATETIVKYDILGNINKEYLQENEERFFVRWKELKPYILSIIKGEKKPKYIKIVFSLDDKTVTTLAENTNAMFLNINYTSKDNLLVCTTGTSQKGFSLDKKEDKIWEDTIINFFKKNSINIRIEE